MDGNLLDTFSVATLLAFVFVLVNFVRNVLALRKARDAEAINSVVTQMAAWGIGIAVVFVCAAAEVANNIAFFGTALKDMDTFSKVIVGFALASGGSVVNDFFAARDNSRTSANPALIGRNVPPE